jgi:hypothetical protein
VVQDGHNLSVGGDVPFLEDMEQRINKQLSIALFCSLSCVCMKFQGKSFPLIFLQIVEKQDYIDLKNEIVFSV